MQQETNKNISSSFNEMKMSKSECPIGNATGKFTLGATTNQEFKSSHEDINFVEDVERFEKPIQDYYKLANEVSKAFAINFGIKYKIFDTIEELSKTTSTTAKDILLKLKFKASQRHLLDLLDQLYVNGLLEREGLLEDAKYSNSAYTKKYLLSSLPQENNYSYFFLNLDRYMIRYESFDKNFPSGKVQLFSDDIFVNEEDTKAYMHYFYRSNKFNFEFLLEKIDFSKYKKIVDIHGLTGCLAMKIKKKFNNVDVCSFDNKKIQKFAESYLEKENLKNLITLSYGDLMKDKIPEANCVVAPHILMNYSYENKKIILKGIYEKLSNNGELIIMENLVDVTRSKDDCGMKISFMFAMMGYEGFSMSFSEFKTLLHEVGFKDITQLPKIRGVNDLIIAKKTST